MQGINKVILVGHLGKAPEFRSLATGVNVVSFPLATTEVVNKEEYTQWHNIVMWRSLADAAVKMLEKGKLIYLEGKMRTRTFEDKAGVQKHTTEIIAENFTILSKINDLKAASRDYQPT